MAKVFGWNAGVLTTNPASGDEKRLREVGYAFCCFKFKEIVDLTNLSYSTAGVPGNAIFSGGRSESVDNGFGVVCSGEHATVRFNFEFNVVPFEPSDGVGWLKSMESADEIFDSTGIVFDKFTGFVAVMGDITSAATRYTDFGEDFWSTF